MNNLTPTRRTLFSFAIAIVLAGTSIASAQDKSIVVCIHHLDAGFRPVRSHPAAVQGQDRHRREGGLARHRPGARHRPARRCRRGVRPRQAAGGEIRRRRLRREALSGDVQRLRPDRAEERSRRHQGQQGHRCRAEDHQGERHFLHLARRQVGHACRRARALEGRRHRHRGRGQGPLVQGDRPGHGRRAQHARPRSTPMCWPTAAPGSRSRTGAISSSRWKATSGCSTSMASCW